jgi:hypothetical protein
METEMEMRFKTLWMVAFSLGVFALPARAQGTLNKVAHDVSSTVKKAGRDTKAEVHRDADKAHNALTDAGNSTKAAAGNATGVHKVGGDVGKAAHKVSHSSKKVGRSARKDMNSAKSQAHKDLTKSGKDAKKEVKTP